MTTTSSTSDLPDTGSATRAFKPGPGFYVLVCLIVLTIVLALSAAITSALGATETSRVLGGIALVLVGLGMLASLRLSARSLVVNAPRLRLERNRVRAALARQGVLQEGRQCQGCPRQGGQGLPILPVGLGNRRCNPARHRSGNAHRAGNQSARARVDRSA